ncbi:MAG: DUF1003 domain-containing protein [Candidatus Aenigmarchaeota archaeon]|nr:DUF1003 domain-containing protein [Candidatus Aenigmarchaeota archaeon]
MSKTNKNKSPGHKLTFGQRAADNLTHFCGTWTFIIALLIFIIIWIGLNITMWIYRWDPYPFILLNFCLSCLAAIQSPIILMSQNREEERARIKAERDYMVNRKAEREVENMQKDLDEIKNLIRQIKK